MKSPDKASVIEALKRVFSLSVIEALKRVFSLIEETKDNISLDELSTSSSLSLKDKKTAEVLLEARQRAERRAEGGFREGLRSSNNISVEQTRRNSVQRANDVPKQENVDSSKEMIIE